MDKAFCTLLLACWLQLTGAAAPAPTVAVDGGTVRGAVGPGQALFFRGIPFAAPPVENLRWRAPQPVAPWTGIRDASGPAAACVQNDQGWNHGDYLSGREDCLTLDIGTQALTGRRPVLVWIHGGSNRAGSPGDMITSPVVGEGIVLVGIRYRLGIFGFLSSRTLSVEGKGSSGNYGLMDQIAALRWVRRNIARFGGNPDNVTIAGESAGSQDVSLLLASPSARGLFAKAIMESGTPGFGLQSRSRDEAERIGDQAEALLGAQRDAAKLRRTSVPALLAADLRLHDEALESDDYMWLRTTIDGGVLPRSPTELLREAPPRPVIVGTNRIELDLPGGRPHRDSMVAKAFGANEARARAFYRLDEPDPPADPRRGNRDQQIATDLVFRCPAGNLADLLGGRGGPVWRYEFDLAPHGGRTRHAQDISYVFGEDRSASGLSLRPYWTRFASTGDPNGPGMPAWPRFTPASRAYEAFEESGFSARTGLDPKSCAWLDRV